MRRPSAKDDPCRHRPEVASKGARHGLVEQSHACGDLAHLCQREPFECAPERLEVGVSVTPGDGMCVARALEDGAPFTGGLCHGGKRRAICIRDRGY